MKYIKHSISYYATNASHWINLEKKSFRSGNPGYIDFYPILFSEKAGGNYTRRDFLLPVPGKSNYVLIDSNGYCNEYKRILFAEQLDISCFDNGNLNVFQNNNTLEYFKLSCSEYREIWQLKLCIVAILSCRV